MADFRKATQTLQERTRTRHSSYFSRLSKGLIAVGIITSLLIPSPSFAKRSKAKNADATVAEETNNSRKIKVERDIIANGQRYHLMLEAVKGTDSVAGCLDSECIPLTLPEKFKGKKFRGKFRIIDMIAGNPSILLVGSYDGNYTFVFIDSLVGESKTAIVGTNMSVAEFSKHRIRVEVRFDEENGRWIISYYNNKGKRMGYVITGEDGQQIENKDLGLCEIITCE